MSEPHPTLTGIEAAGFTSAAVFYYAGRELAVELAAGRTLAEARAVVADRCKVNDAQLDYVVAHSRPWRTGAAMPDLPPAVGRRGKPLYFVTRDPTGAGP